MERQPRQPDTLFLIQQIMQAIVAENPYKVDMVWTLWHEVNRMEEENLLPDGVTAEDVFQEYIRVFEGEGRGA